MRRTISKIPYRPSSAPFSTSSGGGGRGRGGPNPFSFNVPSNDDSKVPSPAGQGHGRGRGVPVNPSPLRNEFDSFLNNDSTSAASVWGRGIGFSSSNLSPPPPPPSGNESDSNFQQPKPSVSSAAPGRGRGTGFSLPNFSPPPPSGKESDSNYQPSKPSVKMPFLFGAAQSDGAESGAAPAQGKPLQTGILGVLAGSGRGMPPRPHTPPPLPQSDRTRLAGGRGRSLTPNRDTPPVREQLGPRDTPVREQLGPGERGRRPEQKLKLIKGDRGGGARDERGWDRRTGAAKREDNLRKEIQYERDDFRKGRYFKDPAYEEKLAKKIGPENMKKVYKGLDEMASRVFTDPKEEALVEAYETNLRLECEPEFIMEEFGTNPDIDEKAQIPIRDALEKMKPFLMAYEGIKSNEDWEEIMEETMKKVPLVKGIIDHYGGPDRVTAKEQCEKLEQAAKTIPASAPASVKRFTDRAVLSLQSNPGWGFEKKCQFMDKLIMEVQQNYK